ncbi:hypothetical protein M758_2G119900 [Ceratodon purpureus]|nr:hypothetical protein M758_2G119900 [Ceratodon purpureus]
MPDPWTLYVVGGNSSSRRCIRASLCRPLRYFVSVNLSVMEVVEWKESQRGAMHDNGMLRATLRVLSSCTASSLASLISFAIPLLYVLSDIYSKALVLLSTLKSKYAAVLSGFVDNE